MLPILLLLLSCTPHLDTADSQGDSSSRAENSFFAFSGDFTIQGHFDGASATFTQERGKLRLQTSAYGRMDRMMDAAFSAPALDACAPSLDATLGCTSAFAATSGFLTEYWSVTDFGFAQSWVIDESPQGSGPLRIDITIPGFWVTVGKGEAWLEGEDGSLWVASGLAAMDEHGRSLDIDFDRSKKGLSIVVHDAGAKYPLRIDPVYTTASLTVVGSLANGYIGSALGQAGDINGDGYDDVVFGASRYSNYTGRVYVYYGSSTGLPSTAGMTLTGFALGTSFGEAVAGAGDVNGDGYADVIIGAHNGTTGMAYVHHGSAAGLSSVANSTLSGSATSEQFGSSVAGVGDVNGDGYDDVVVGAPQYNTQSGRATIYYGSTSGIVSSGATTITGVSTFGGFGSPVGSAGDINGDGYADIVVSAANYSGATGQTYVFHGSANGITSTSASAANNIYTGSTSSEYFGSSVSGIGDVNQDGYDDLAIGARAASGFNGQVYVYYGSSTGLPSAPSLTYTGATSLDALGASVARAGDVNGDGFPDLIAGAHGCNSFRGCVYVYQGSSQGLSATAITSLSGTTAYALYGFFTNGAGDVNGDGYDDIIVGASVDSGVGKAFVHHGYEDADLDGYAATADCDDTNANVNAGATELIADGVDQNCDGVDSCYQDSDRDGYGGPLIQTGNDLDCIDFGEGTTSSDCDDGDATISPQAIEIVADGLDQDCDGGDTCYTDSDGDTYGSANVTTASADLSCTDIGEAQLNTDCDDNSTLTHPGATEIAGDGLDQDCDGGERCYVDSDGDGDGTTIQISSADLDCADPGEAPTATDCSPSDATVYTGATEVVGDGLDQDCDGGDQCYLDADADTYGGTSTVVSADRDCGDGGESLVSNDCDDSDRSVNPGASDVVGDGVDQDCDGGDSCYADNDHDGYGSTGTMPSSDGDCSDAGESLISSDCDDSRATVNPSAPERCDIDNLDEDCDGLIDDDDPTAIGQSTWYVDYDSDGYGVSSQFDQAACEAPTGFSAVNTDCDDTDSAIHPEAPETPNDGIDQDCDGSDAASSGDDTAADDSELSTDDTGGSGRADKDCGCASSSSRSAGWAFGLLIYALGIRTRAGRGPIPTA